jgi:hypothetical protein
MWLFDPHLARVIHEERLREAAERHKVELALTWAPAPRQWVLRFLPRRAMRRSDQHRRRAA